MNLKELYDIKGSVAIVTGGSTGLGYHMAMGFAEAGANLVIASIEYELCKEVADIFKQKYNIDALALKLNVIKEEDIIKMVNSTIDYYGKIDILVNNAGGGIPSAVRNTKLADWNHIMNLNSTAVFLCCREVGKHMIEKKYGKIINIASIYGMRGTDPRIEPDNPEESGNLSYCTTKGAIINLTRDLAVNWAKYNITVNAISPGPIMHEHNQKYYVSERGQNLANRVPMGRLGDGDDLKAAALFLASKASKFITGINLPVDGGYSSW